MTSKKIVRALRELAEETGLDAPQALNYNALCFLKGKHASIGIAPYRTHVSLIFATDALRWMIQQTYRRDTGTSDSISQPMSGARAKLSPFKSASRNATNSNEPFARSVPVPSSCGRGRHHKML